MTRKLLLFLSESGEQIVSALAIDGTVPSAVETTAEALSAAAEGGDVVAVLAGEAVSSWRLDLPTLPEAKLLQILPSQLEDLQADRRDDDHYALLADREPSDDDPSRLVACISGDVMQATAACLHGMHLEPTALIPDYALLPAADTDQVAPHPTDEGRRLVRLADGTGFAADAVLAGAVAPGAGTASVSLDAQLVDDAVSGFNLLQGRFRPKLALVSYIPLLRRGLLLAVLAGLLWVAGVYLITERNIAAAERIDAEAESLFRSAFPDVNRIVDMELQAERQLAIRRAGQGGTFLRVSRQVFAAVRDVESALIESMRYNENQDAFFITVSFSSFGESDRFRGRLAGSGLRVTEGGSRQDNERVVTDMAIEVAP